MRFTYLCYYTEIHINTERKTTNITDKYCQISQKQLSYSYLEGL